MGNGNCWPNCKLKSTSTTTATTANKHNNDANNKYKQQTITTTTTLTNNNKNSNKKTSSANGKKHKLLFKTTTINGSSSSNNSKNKNGFLMQQHHHQDAAATLQQQLPTTPTHGATSSININSSEQQSQKSILLPRRDIDFKQFCRNSADKLTHKLSFNKSKSPQQTSSSSHVTADICTINENKINALFDKYKDASDSSSILTDGVQQLCDDLQLKNDDFKLLLFAWKFNLKTMCKITKDEFVNGFKMLVKIDNLKDLYQKLVQLNEDINKDRNEFRNLYRWTFDFGLDKEAGERTLPLEIAITLWDIVYKNEHEPAILSNWLKFLKDNPTIKGIPRDTWFMFPLFASSVGQFAYNLYDDNEAWPCLFDEFVQHEIANNENTIKLELKQQQQQQNENECELVN